MRAHVLWGGYKVYRVVFHCPLGIATNDDQRSRVVRTKKQNWKSANVV